MIMPEVLTRILLHPHMLCKPLFRRVCSVALISIKLQILHSKSEKKEISETMLVFSNFLVLLAFSAGSVSSTYSVVVSLIFPSSL